MAHMAHYNEAHPVPLVVTHYINLICMCILIFTGFMIHYPYISSIMGPCRGIHICCGIIVGINLIVRVIFMFTVKGAPTQGTRVLDKDYKNWFPQVDNRHQMGPQLKYYLFMKKEHPLTAKFNPLQKLAYWFAGLLILFMVITGLSLWEVTAPAFAGLTAAWGGAMSMRIIHYFGMFVMIIFMIAHIYLVCLDGMPTFKSMFARREHGGLVYDPEKHSIVGEDNSI
ncbi:MAG: cytochrome b/b6 domain-containing protein [Eggerthellaceae bacterium]|jgi:Ni/Fe-hydrogenase 1 B-type cytochrome subunit